MVIVSTLRVASVKHVMPAVKLVWQVEETLSVAAVGTEHSTLRGGVCLTVLQGMPVMQSVVNVFPVLLAVISAR